MMLVGCGSAGERDWFGLLMAVRGVVGKVALNILSARDAEKLRRAVGTQDNAMVARANGMRPKLAERIVRELKDKFSGVAIGVAGAVPMASGGIAADSVSAPAGLGFKPGEAGAAVVRAKAELGGSATLDALVRLALRKTGR
jgi:holliday junction DNA helicase RuvA